MTINSIPANKLATTYRTNKIIGIAMAGSVLVYAVIVEVFRFQEISLSLFPPELLDKLRFFAVFLAFAMYFVINFLNQKILVKNRGDSFEALLGRLTLANVLSLALCELPAVFGLVLFLGSGNPRDFYLLLIVSALLFYAFFPKYGFWSNWSRVSDPSGQS